MDKTKKRIAVFPAGSEIGLEINNALKYSTFFEVYGFTSVINHSRYVYKNCIEDIPMINDENFFSKFNEYIDKLKIDFIYPALDDVQLFLMRYENQIHAKIISADLFTVEICRSKSKTYEFFKNEDFIPKTYSTGSCIDNFPVFVKPDIGQGSQGAKLIESQDFLDVELQKKIPLVVCEYLPGEEFTIDCFTNDKGQIISAKMRNRKRIRNGISVSSEILKTPNQVLAIAEKINSKLHFNGAWFFQLKKNLMNQYKLLEIAPRIAGTMGITRNTGTNYPLMTVFQFLKADVRIINNNYDICVDRALISRFSTSIQYDTVYLDLDDTLILDNKVNTLLMQLLYQFKNEDKNIVLLTKHSVDPAITLDKYHIDYKLFDNIIWIKQSDNKALYITDKNSIFIDDSFSERLNISNTVGIPVFDCSEIETLLNWKV